LRRLSIKVKVKTRRKVKRIRRIGLRRGIGSDAAVIAAKVSVVVIEFNFKKFR